MIEVQKKRVFPFENKKTRLIMPLKPKVSKISIGAATLLKKSYPRSLAPPEAPEQISNLPPCGGPLVVFLKPSFMEIRCLCKKRFFLGLAIKAWEVLMPSTALKIKCGEDPG